jgi:hypothetical protein
LSRDGGRKRLEIDDSIYCLTFICMIKKVADRLKLRDTVEIPDYFFKSFFIFAIQAMIMIFVFYSVMTNSDGNEYIKPPAQNMSLRLLCSYLFHLGNYGDLSSSFKN